MLHAHCVLMDEPQSKSRISSGADFINRLKNFTRNFLDVSFAQKKQDVARELRFRAQYNWRFRPTVESYLLY